MVAHHHAVGNKTVPVFRKQCFTFTLGVGIATSKLSQDIQFLIRVRNYVFI